MSLTAPAPKAPNLIAPTAPSQSAPTAPVPSALGVPSALTAPQRVAIILSLLDPDNARALAERLEPGTVDRVIAAYEAMGTLPRPAVLEVIARFVAEMASPYPSVRGGARQAEALASALLPEAAPDGAADGAPRLSSIAEGAEPDAVWAHVEGMEPPQLAGLLAEERVAVIAAAVPRLSDAKGGALLAALPEDTAARVARALAGGARVSPPTLDAIAESLRVRAASGGETEAAPDGTAHLTALLNRCPYSRQEAVLAHLREADAEVATRIEAGLLRFASLAERLPRNAVPMLFREADQAVLDRALAHGLKANPEATEFLFSNISQRLAEQIRERVAETPTPDEADGEAAQATLIGTLLGWAEDGRFALADIEAEAA